MRKFRKDITSQGFYDKYQILKNFSPGEVATEEEIKRFGIPENVLEPLMEKKTLEKDEDQIALEKLQAQPFLGKVEFAGEKKEPVKKKRGRPKKNK